MASGETMCVAMGEGSTYCIPSRGPLVAMPTPRPEKINQLVSQLQSIYYHGYLVLWQAITMVTMLCGKLKIIFTCNFV